MKKRLFSVISLSFLTLLFWNPTMIHAEMYGIGPGRMLLEIMPNRQKKVTFKILRRDALLDQRMDVSVKGDGFKHVRLDGGTSLFLPKGKQQVSYTVTIDSTNLVSNHDYSFEVSFLNQEVESNTGSTAFIFGVTGIIQLHVVDKLTEPTNISSEETVSDQIQLSQFSIENLGHAYNKSVHLTLKKSEKENVKRFF